ncbi:MAG: CBS domain-containing protein [Candidatus Omnitrophica bacterium]|nr:CBS domain-containing protein [Candidatus Omnitrophota bacterium]
MKTVGQVMRKNLICVSPDRAVWETIRMMREKNIGAVLVTEGTALRGIFTERDLITKVFTDAATLMQVPQQPISAFMTSRLITVTPEDTCDGLAERMKKFNIRHLPVVVDNAVVGIVSLRDVLWDYYEALMEELVSQVSEKVQMEQRLTYAMETILDLQRQIAQRPGA